MHIFLHQKAKWIKALSVSKELQEISFTVTEQLCGVQWKSVSFAYVCLTWRICDVFNRIIYKQIFFLDSS